MNIKSKQDLLEALTPHIHRRDLAVLTVEADMRYGSLDDANFWQHRDFLRLNWSGAEGVLSDKEWEPAIYAGNYGHYLHYSTKFNSGEQMVAYTKNPENGRADIQTRTTLEAYQDTYGQVDTNEDLMPAKEEVNPNHASLKGLSGDANAFDVPKEPTKEQVIDDIVKQKEAEAFLRGIHMVVHNMAEADDDKGHDELIVKAVYKALKILDTLSRKGV